MKPVESSGDGPQGWRVTSESPKASLLIGKNIALEILAQSPTASKETQLGDNRVCWIRHDRGQDEPIYVAVRVQDVGDAVFSTKDPALPRLMRSQRLESNEACLNFIEISRFMKISFDEFRDIHRYIEENRKKYENKNAYIS